MATVHLLCCFPILVEYALELYNYKIYIDEELNNGGCEEIKEWARRASQHAARVAGIIFLLENDSDPMARKYIPKEYVNVAIDIIEILRGNLYDCIFNFYNDTVKDITCEIGLKIIRDNERSFNETDFKQKVKNRYSAEEVEAALRKLEIRGFISREDRGDERSHSRGRPRGNNFGIIIMNNL